MEIHKLKKNLTYSNLSLINKTNEIIVDINESEKSEMRSINYSNNWGQYVDIENIEIKNKKGKHHLIIYLLNFIIKIIFSRLH